MASKDNFGDARLKKDAGDSVRGSRAASDMERTNNDGSALTAEERRRLLRQDWVQNILPTPPDMPGFHCCWLSTTNSTDPIYKRIQRGYIPVKATEVVGFGNQFTVQGGEFDGCVVCNEMLLFKIDVQTYHDLMTIYHYEMPNEQEMAIRERVDNVQEHTRSGESAGRLEVEGEFNKLGRETVRPPTSFA